MCSPQAAGSIYIGEGAVLSPGRLSDLTERARLAGLPLWISGIVAGSPSALIAQLDLLAEKNHHISLWHDGSTPPYGLREESRGLTLPGKHFSLAPGCLRRSVGT